MHAVVRWALDRRPVVLFATMIVIVGGILGTTQLRQQVFPDIEFPFLIAAIDAEGLDAAAVDERVGQPLAAAAESVSGVGVITTVSQEGELRVYAELDFGTDVDAVTEEVLDEWDAVALPPGVGEPRVEEGFTEQAVVQAALLASDQAQVAELSQEAMALRDELASIDGVGRVDVTGVPTPRWLVTVTPQALRSGVLPGEVADALGQVDLRATAGAIPGEQGFPLQVVVSGPQVETAADLEQVTLPGLGTLGEIATVERQVDPSAGFSRTNGQPSVGIDVFRETTADEVATVDAVTETLEEWEQDGGEIAVLYESAGNIRASIRGLAVEAVAGSIGAVLVIFLFLRSIRGTLVAAVSIPTSIVFGLLVAWWLGLTINIITLAGLTIAVGRVIDDGIVVLESIYQRLERGEGRRQAMVEGTADVATAIASSTVATIAVFLPIGLVGGMVSEIFLSFSIIVSVALAASLLVAITVIPVVGSFVLRPSDQPTHGETSLQRVAGPAARFGVRWWWLVLIIAIIAVAIPFGAIASGAVPTQFLPGSGTQQVYGSVSLQPGTPPDAAQRALQPLDERLNEVEGLEDVQIGYGDAATDFDFQTTASTASFLLVLEEGVDAEAVVEDLREFGTEAYPGTFRVSRLQMGPPSGQFQALVEGEDQEAIAAASQQLVDVLEARDDAVEIGQQASRSVPQLVATLRPGAPVSAAAVEQALAAAAGQQDAGTISGTQVIVEGGIDADPATISALPVAVPGSGQTVPLGQVATVAPQESPAFINRVDGVQAAQVSAKLTGPDVAGAVAEIREELEDLPGAGTNADDQVTLDGATFNFDQGDQAFIDDMFRDMGIAMLVAVVLVFLVVVVFFGSVALPFAILAPVLFSFIGSLGALTIASIFDADQALGLPAMIGQLLLIGIIVSNSILLIDAALKHRRTGLHRDDALVAASRERVRPVLMTAFATIAALTPLATGLAATLGITEEGGIISQSLGIVVIGGLLVATLLTLVVVPATAHLLDRDRDMTRHWGEDPSPGG